MNEAQYYDKGAVIQVYIYIYYIFIYTSLTFHLLANMLKSAANTKSNGDWWIKVDSCDLTSGLMESVDGKW